MATVSKSSKINFYKFVQVKKPSNDAKSAGDIQLTNALNTNTKALNNLGATVNSLSKVLVDLKKIAIIDLEREQKNQKTFTAKFAKEKEQRKKLGFSGNLGANQVKGFFESLLGVLGNLFKVVIGKKVLDWIADPKNRETLKSVINGIVSFGKFVFKWAKFGVTSTIDGLYELFSGETTWWEKTLGFGKAIVGIGTILLGIRYLKNPLKIIKDISTSIKLLIAFTKGKGALGMLGKIGLGAGALWLLSEGVFTRPAGDGTMDNMPELTPEQKKLSEELRRQRIEAGLEREVPQRAGGGWISGPQSGYPVSLDGGRSTSFIGHGTEYVARKAGGGAFVVPFNTSATKRMPGLTEKRIGEAKKAGFKLPGFAAGGNLNKQIYLHWTASRYNWKNGPYHTTVQGDGSLYKHKKYNQHTPHTYYRNSGNVGLSMAGMKGWDWENYGPKKVQLEAMMAEAANVAKTWGWTANDVNIKRVMTHAEAASNKDGRRPHDNYGPVFWGGTGERSDLHKLSRNDRDGSGGDKLRQMMKKYMGMENPPVLNEAGPGTDNSGANGQISNKEYALLQKLVIAEAGGEGELGMALVARSIMNRAGLIQKGIVGKGMFMANDSSITGVIMGKNQYQPVRDGSLDKPRTQAQMDAAKRAIEMARHPASLRANLESKNIAAEQINYLLASTGFRTGSAFKDESQNINVVQFGNHFFNTAGNKDLKTPESELALGGTGGGRPRGGVDSVDNSATFSMDKPKLVGAGLLGSRSTRGDTSMGDYSQSTTGVRPGQSMSSRNINGTGSGSPQEMLRATQQRNDAKQLIVQFAQQGVQATVAQVTQNNAAAGQIAQQATSLIGTMINNASSGAPVMQGTGSGIVKTTASVLNSFNNPLKGILK